MMRDMLKISHMAAMGKAWTNIDTKKTEGIHISYVPELFHY